MENTNKSHTNKYQQHAACSYDYKLLCVDDKFSKPFKSYLGKDTVYNSISSMIEEINIVVMWWKNVLTKNLRRLKKKTKIFWIYDNAYFGGDIKVRDHCHITGKYRGSAHRDCDINVKLNHKIPVLIHNLNSYDSHLMQELGKFSLKINLISNGLKKYMSFGINSKLYFIDSFQFLSFSLDSLVKNLAKDRFKYLSQEFDDIY